MSKRGQQQESLRKKAKDRAHREPDSSRRNFMKTAGAAAAAVLIRDSAWAQGNPAKAATLHFLPQINPHFMITPDQAWDWASFKSQGGPTYAGSAGWKRYTDFLISKMPEFGAVDLDYVEIPYDHYIVDDWPDRRTHVYDSGMAVEKLGSDGTPVPAVASFRLTSGSTPAEGTTPPLIPFDAPPPPDKSLITASI